jgi:hypothetical protein
MSLQMKNTTQKIHKRKIVETTNKAIAVYTDLNLWTVPYNT